MKDIFWEIKKALGRFALILIRNTGNIFELLLHFYSHKIYKPNDVRTQFLFLLRIACIRNSKPKPL